MISDNNYTCQIVLKPFLHVRILIIDIYSDLELRTTSLLRATLTQKLRDSWSGDFN